MKKLSLLIVLFILTSPLMAQTKKISSISESGSGNGTINRDVLDYKTEINQQNLAIRSLEEAFDKLKQDILNIANATLPPVVSPDSDFWTRFSDKDQQTLQDMDSALTKVVESSIVELEKIKKVILNEQVIIETMATDSSKFSELNFEKEFVKLMDQKRASLKDRLPRDLRKIPSLLLSPLVIVESRKIGMRDARGGTLTYKEEAYAHHFSDQTYRALSKCETVVCVNLLVKKLEAYSQMVSQTGDIKIQMLGIKKPLKEFYGMSHLSSADEFRNDEYCSSHKEVACYKNMQKRKTSFDFQLSVAGKDLKESQFTYLNELHEKSIRGSF